MAPLPLSSAAGHALCEPAEISATDLVRGGFQTAPSVHSGLLCTLGNSLSARLSYACALIACTKWPTV